MEIQSLFVSPNGVFTEKQNNNDELIAESVAKNVSESANANEPVKGDVLSISIAARQASSLRISASIQNSNENTQNLDFFQRIEQKAGELSADLAHRLRETANKVVKSSMFQQKSQMPSMDDFIAKIENIKDPDDLEKYLDDIDSGAGNGVYDRINKAIIEKTMQAQGKDIEKQEVNIDSAPVTQSGSKDNIQNLSIEMSSERSVEFQETVEMTVQQEQGSQKQVDPLVIDLDGDGIEISSLEDGITFDIEGSGKKVLTQFAVGGDAVLAIDKNGNGRIDNGKELFGDQNGSANGFEELKKYDENKDGKIDIQDSIFNQILLWLDKNKDGVSSKGEVKTLSQMDIQSLNLNYKNVNNGPIVQLASYTKKDGTTGALGDAMFSIKA